jgi:putative acetyltransferase
VDSIRAQRSERWLSVTGATVRPEESRDADGVRLVNQRAFGRPSEAALVDALRSSAGAMSLVATVGTTVAGHILFTAVQVGDVKTRMSAAGLAPMAVLPEYQRQGIGSQLVRAGLDACRAEGHGLVVVVGHPEFYPRFGFVPASTIGLEYEHPVHPEAFMVLELQAGALAQVRGIVRYRPEFTAMIPS